MLILVVLFSKGQSSVTDFYYNIREIQCDYKFVDFYFDVNDAEAFDSCCWYFGDGSKRFAKNSNNSSRNYSKPGNYTVELKLWKHGIEKSIIKEDLISIPVAPKVNFTFEIDETSNFAPVEVQFNNATEFGDGENLSYLWDFDDGESSTELNPVHTYNKSGTFSVKLEVNDSLGCNKAAYQMLVVKDSAQRGEVSFINSRCYSDPEIDLSPCGTEKHYELRNDSLIVYGFYYGNCTTEKTATISFRHDTVAIQTWESGLAATCGCGFCFEIVIDHFYLSDFTVLFNETPVSEKKQKSVNGITSYGNEISIFPNPIDDIVYVEMPEAANNNFLYELYNQSGQIVLWGQLTSTCSEISTQMLKNGQYIFVVRSQQEIIYNSKISKR